MNIEALQHICRAFPGVTEDIKWGTDLAFCVGGKMFCVVNTEPPYQMSFKCTPEDFGELVERPGLIPAPYLARAMWVQERELGEALDRREVERLLRTAYELVKAKLPKRARPGAAALPAPRRPRSAAAATRGRRR
jgi:predicted DNA-binding protein (MmcQ/YjbR family)